MFTHLHVHSEFSLLDGMCHIPQLVSRAKDLGMESLAITDHGVLHGVISFYQQAREAGIKPIIGCELYVAANDRHSRLPADKNPYHLILLAKNETGYRNLLHLATIAQLEGFYYKPRVDKEVLQQYCEGLVALSACPSGELGRYILERRLDEAEKAAKWYKEVFEDFYLELQNHAIDDLKIINRELIALSRKLDIPLVATNDVHYVNQDDSYAHDILLCIQTNNTIHNNKRPRMADDSFYLKSQQEMADQFSEIPEAITNTERIAEMCNLELEFGRLLLPEIELPPSKTPDQYLAELARDGFAKRYPDRSDQPQQRLEYELDVIKKTEFANYFLVVWDLISYVRREKILFGVRGSAAASIVLYCLGITDIDPLAHKLVFERFLNVERKEMPDIDLDFQDDRRDEVIYYAAQKYGADHVAQIITFGTLGARAAIRDVGRALGMPYGDVDRVAKLIPELPLTITITEALASNTELNNVYSSDLNVKHLIDTSAKVEGIARHASTHAAGVVISKESLLNHVPLQRPSKANGQSVNMTQFAMGDIATIGLLKMDFLGLSNLTILEKTIETIRRIHGKEIDIHSLPLDDTKTFELLSSGETTGVFQLEGAVMRRYIKELQPSCFGDIAAMVALYRPGPKDHIPAFIRSKHGLEPISFPHPVLAEILEDTYGIIVYQDQVLFIVQTFAGYSLGEADIVRKAMGKKIPAVMKKESQRFLAGAKTKGFSKELANEVWSLIEPFAGYAFNRAHSVSYAMIAYQTAYLKANYPVEFICSLLATNIERTSKVTAAISECQRLGITVKPPDINYSMESFSIERDDQGNAAIRFGLSAIKNVGTAAVKALIESRDPEKPFITLEDFCRRANLRNMNKRTLESLIKAGALDCLSDRGCLLAGIDRILSLSQTEQRLKDAGQATMFDLWGDSVNIPLPALDLPETDISAKMRLDWERELMGVYFSEHPFTQASKHLASRVDALCGHIGDELAGQSIVTAGVVTLVRHAYTRDGRSFASAVLEDFGGSIEVTAWNHVYERTKDLWQEGNILLIEGKVRMRSDNVQLVCSGATLYQPEKFKDAPTVQTDMDTSSPQSTLHINLATTSNSDADLDRLNRVFDILKQYPGEYQVYLSIVSDGRIIKMELPTMTAKCCPELHKQLSNIVGEQAIRIDSTANQIYSSNPSS